MNDRLPPQVQLWTWPDHLLEPGRITTRQPGTPAAPAVPVRIGDAERDEAVASLGDHFAAGRLTREEFDTRVDQAMAARFDGDLRPLFEDLPKAKPAAPAAAVVPAYAGSRAVPARSAASLMVMSLLPFLMVSAVVTAVVLSAPWMLWMFFWVAVMASVMGRRPYQYPRR